MSFLVFLRERTGFFVAGCCKLCFRKIDTEEVSVVETHLGNAPIPAYIHDTCHTCRRKEKNRIHSNNNRKRLRRLGRSRGNLAYTQWMKVLGAHDYSCAHCKRKGRRHLTLDHIISINDGGLNLAHNVQPLCKKCHATKDRHESIGMRGFVRRNYRRFRKWLRLTTGIRLPHP